jgi:excisionase family DNA binding protein
MTTVAAGECLTVRAVAEALAVGEAHVRRLLRVKRLRGVRVGVRQWRIPAASLEEFLNGDRVDRQTAAVAKRAVLPAGVRGDENGGRR